MSKREKVIFYGCIGILVFLLISGGVVAFLVFREGGKQFWEGFDDFDKNAQPWTECPIDLPDKAGRIVFLRRHNHPFLAEYDRKIRYETSVLASVRLLPPNTGGKTRINVYYYEAKNGQGPYIKFQDQYGNYRFDLGHDVKETLSIPDALTREYIGRLDGVREPLRFISAEESTEERIERRR
ncbi:MAG: hypothetical protein ACYSUY_12785 [Planctomycetota bacterium]|jgi:hypothetical protein